MGHVFLPFAFLVNVDWMPVWAAMGMWATCFTAIALAILPRAKALFIAVLWHTRAPGYDSPNRTSPSSRLIISRRCP